MTRHELEVKKSWWYGFITAIVLISVIELFLDAVLLP